MSTIARGGQLTSVSVLALSPHHRDGTSTRSLFDSQGIVTLVPCGNCTRALAGTVLAGRPVYSGYLQANSMWLIVGLSTTSI